MEYIRDYLKKIEKLDPIPTGLRPSIKKDLEVRAIVFDVYGTLLISVPGKVNGNSFSASHLRTALRAGGMKIVPQENKDDWEYLNRLLNAFVNSIQEWREEHQSLSVLHPEVDILGIWEDVLSKASEQGWLKMGQEKDVKRMAVIFEILNHKIFPMPGMAEVLEQLNKKGFVLGIISNAQFYTPLFMNYFLGSKTFSEDSIPYFDPELTVFSYRMRQAKPDTALFEKIIPVLDEKYGIQPGESLFVGNDMLNDVKTAHDSGFKTALFAGDERSLQQRREIKDLAGLTPDVIITELKQLLKIRKK